MKSQTCASDPSCERVTRTDRVRLEVLKRYAWVATQGAAVAPTPRVAACHHPHSGLGCGSPTTFARLAPGEWVLDLGSGAGFDCLAAGVEVGRAGRVVGVDMTPEMVRLACRHLAESGIANVQYVQAEIEQLPFADATFDVVLSNCVLNLCSGKKQALAEAARVLKPGGRLAIADIVAVVPLDEDTRKDLALYTGCIAGGTPVASFPGMLREAGFASVEIVIDQHSNSLLESWAPGMEFDRYVAAARVTASKVVGC